LTHRTPISHESHPIGDIWEHFWLPRILERHRVGVLHGPATLIPLRRADYATVVTIHDLVAFLFPDTIPRKYGMYMRWLLRHVVRRADRIISVSHNTKNDLVKILRVNPDKITVIHEAAQPSFKPIQDSKRLGEACRRYGIDRPFIYHVGNIEPRKNLVRLIKAYLILRGRLGNDVRLAITGQKGWLTKKLMKALGGVELGEDVIYTGYVPHEDLPLLMNAAQAFVFPSLYEGFGLPVLEAMSCGTPVVTSNISSLPEIVGDAAVLVDPHSEESIALGMQKVLEDKELRRRLRREGLAQAGRFSWEKAALSTLEVYRDVYHLGGGA
jgi:glycosyltransferase involved in cell wall biosynthesis